MSEQANPCPLCGQSPSVHYWRRESEGLHFCTIRCECCGIKCEGAGSIAAMEARSFYLNEAAMVAVERWNVAIKESRK